MKKKRRSKIKRGILFGLTPLQKAGITLGLLSVGGFITYKVAKNQIDKMKMRSDIKKFKTQTVEDLNINLAEVAKQIYDALGVGYASYDPRSWNENEEAASLAVLKVPKPFISQLENIYQINHKRNLRNDLQSYLEEYWNEVRYLFV